MKKAISILASAALALTLVFSGANTTAQEVVECNWGLEECHRVVVDGHTYVYHGKKVVEDPQIN